ncbi:MAG TPA: hypothetical protein VL688_02740, partial [Verrucomicrobiae bacterium]|nr:hypothetical protein [Verrucomicrobiae bacterium]
MKKLFLFSIALFLLAPLRPAHAHISDDEKELELEFIQAKDLFHEGKTDKTVALLKDLASDPRHPAYAQVKAAAAIADLLRWQYGQGKVDEALSKDLDKLQADLTKALEPWGDAPLKKVLDPSLAYLAETQKFLADKKPVSA